MPGRSGNLYQLACANYGDLIVEAGNVNLPRLFYAAVLLKYAAYADAAGVAGDFIGKDPHVANNRP